MSKKSFVFFSKELNDECKGVPYSFIKVCLWDNCSCHGITLGHHTSVIENSIILSNVYCLLPLDKCHTQLFRAAVSP